jgi:phage shock protein C
MAEQKRLIRSTTDRKVAGVAGGLARYFEIDPTFVRLAFVVLALLNGIGVLFYLVLWLVIPDEQSRELSGEAAVRANIDDMKAQAQRLTGNLRGTGRGPELVGIGMVAMGAIFLLHQFLPAVPAGVVWPVVIIGLGVYILVRR